MYYFDAHWSQWVRRLLTMSGYVLDLSLTGEWDEVREERIRLHRTVDRTITLVPELPADVRERMARRLGAGADRPADRLQLRGPLRPAEHRRRRPEPHGGRGRPRRVHHPPREGAGVVKLSEIRGHIEENNGYCTTCKQVTQFGGVEPDARKYECPECHNMTVYGMEEAAAIMMVVPIDAGDDEDLDDEDLDDLFD